MTETINLDSQPSLSMLGTLTSSFKLDSLLAASQDTENSPAYHNILLESKHSNKMFKQKSWITAAAEAIEEEKHPNQPSGVCPTCGAEKSVKDLKK